MNEIKFNNAISDLIDYIKEYESDTFSASGIKLTDIEAKSIANWLISDIMENIDGVKLDHILYDLRNNAND